MNDLSQTLRTIRQRLGKTMVEFSEMIGCRQSTVSRYESGKLIPGRSVLLLILQLAQGAERKPILEVLGVGPTAAAGWPERDLLGALKTFEQYLELPAPSKGRAPAASLTAFARAAKSIVMGRAEVDPSLVTIVKQWAEHGANPKAVQHFRHIASYLDVELSVLAGSKRPRRQRSASILKASAPDTP